MYLYKNFEIFVIILKILLYNNINNNKYVNKLLKSSVTFALKV